MLSSCRGSPHGDDVEFSGDGFEGLVGDLKSAFTQSAPLVRANGKLYCRSVRKHARAPRRSDLRNCFGMLWFARRSVALAQNTDHLPHGSAGIQAECHGPLRVFSMVHLKDVTENNAEKKTMSYMEWWQWKSMTC